MIGQDPEAEALAKRRFMVLNLIRFSGLAFVMLGIAVAQEVIELPMFAGIAFAVIGLFDFFIAPGLLSRSWRKGER